MTGNEFIHGSPKEWNLEMPENSVAQDGIPLIQSLTVCQSNRDENIAGAIIKVEHIRLNQDIRL